MAMAAAQSKHRAVKLLLMGITGSGKSSTGNSILGRKQFAVGHSFLSKTDKVSCGYVEVDDLILHVIDGPGLEDTASKNKIDDTVKAVANVGEALRLCNGYVDALLLVIKYGDRFTDEQRNAVEAVQRIIGTEGMHKFGIVIITKKARWAKEYPDKQTLEKWCRANDEYCGNIFSLCQFRSVLFENQPKDLVAKQEFQSQRTELLQYVHGMKAQGTYTNEHFKRAEDERSKYITEKKCFILKEIYQREISLLHSEIIKNSEIEDENEKLKSYKNIKQKAEALIKKIQEDDRGSGILVQLEDTLKGIVKAAKDKNNETLLELGSKIERLRTERKGALTYAILSGIAAVLTIGLATPLFIRKLKELAKVDETIDSNEKTKQEYEK